MCIQAAHFWPYGRAEGLWPYVETNTILLDGAPGRL